jgi:predicted nucleic acid-binding protein
MITDTQVLSYYHKGVLAVPVERVRISSITAAEFLLIQSQTHHNKANYYPILPARLRHHSAGVGSMEAPLRMDFDSRRHAALGKHRTDQLILNFGPNVPAYVEFGGIAITQIINERHEQLYVSSIAHLDKVLQKKLRDRFRFLLEIGVACVAVTPAVATVALNLLEQFLDQYQAKQNTRNTLNDVLVLATAIEGAAALLTEDNLLRRFAADVMGATCKVQLGRLLLDFSTPETSKRRKPLESKGYINRGWQVLERSSR